MGVSTNAYLAYGYDYGDEVPWLRDKEDCPKHLLLFWDDLEDRIDKYELEKELLRQFGVDFVYHCSDEWREVILAIGKSVTCASRGYPRTITHQCVVGDDWKERLDAARAWLGDNESREYNWLLASYWG